MLNRGLRIALSLSCIISLRVSSIMLNGLRVSPASCLELSSLFDLVFGAIIDEVIMHDESAVDGLPELPGLHFLAPFHRAAWQVDTEGQGCRLGQKPIGQILCTVAERPDLKREAMRTDFDELRVKGELIVDVEPTHAAGSPGPGAIGAGSFDWFHLGFLQLGQRTG